MNESEKSFIEVKYHGHLTREQKTQLEPWLTQLEELTGLPVVVMGPNETLTVHRPMDERLLAVLDRIATALEAGNDPDDGYDQDGEPLPQPLNPNKRPRY